MSNTVKHIEKVTVRILVSAAGAYHTFIRNVNISVNISMNVLMYTTDAFCRSNLAIAICSKSMSETKLDRNFT